VILGNHEHNTDLILDLDGEPHWRTQKHSTFDKTLSVNEMRTYTPTTDLLSVVGYADDDRLQEFINNEGIGTITMVDEHEFVYGPDGHLGFYTP